MTMTKRQYPLILICALMLIAPRQTMGQDNGVHQVEPITQGRLRFGATVIYLEDDIKETLEFYSEAFGFEISYYDENLRFGELNTGDTSIMLASYEAGEVMAGAAFSEWIARKPTSVEIAFLTDDVPAAYAKALAAGATSAQEPKTFPWGQTAAYVFSIEGTLVGILTPPPRLE
ncbi:MAG: VOC family protein [Pseudomonadales bacterium]|nr:VOC family protein [Pseudomonadales bacterium]